MVAFATVSDLVARWRPLSPSEQATATSLLDDASAIIRAECPGIDARLTVVPPATEPELDPGVPLMVACRMVKRSMVSGPEVEGVTTKQESAGSLSLSLSYANPTGDLYLTKQDRRLLGYSTARAFTIDTAPPVAAGEVPGWWV